MLASFPAAPVANFLSTLHPCLHPNIAMSYGVAQTMGACATIVLEDHIIVTSSR